MTNLPVRLLFILVSISSNLFAQAIVQNGLIADYPFNGNVQDETGITGQGVVFGAIPATDRFGNANSAYEFDGAVSRIDFPTDFDLPERTINLWFYGDSIGFVAGTIYSSDHQGIENGVTGILALQIGALGTKFVRFAYGVASANTNYEILKNQWYMATFARDTTITRFFLNGIQVDTFPSSTNHSQNGDTIARIGATRIPDRFFDGLIDDLRVYNRVLDQEEIDSLYQYDPLGLSDESGNKVIVYPNPSRDILRIKLDGGQSNNGISLFDSKGKAVKAPFKIENKTLQFDASELNRGLYFLILESEEGSIVEKILIE